MVKIDSQKKELQSKLRQILTKDFQEKHFWKVNLFKSHGWKVDFDIHENNQESVLRAEKRIEGVGMIYLTYQKSKSTICIPSSIDLNTLRFELYQLDEILGQGTC